MLLENRESWYLEDDDEDEADTKDDDDTPSGCMMAVVEDEVDRVSRRTAKTVSDLLNPETPEEIVQQSRWKSHPMSISALTEPPVNAASSPSDAMSIDENEDAVDRMDLDPPGTPGDDAAIDTTLVFDYVEMNVHTPLPKNKRSSSVNSSDQPPSASKRLWINNQVTTFFTEVRKGTLKQSSKKGRSKPPPLTEDTVHGGPVGISRSATASRKLNDAVKEGTFVMDDAQLQTYKATILALDRRAQFQFEPK